MLPTPKLFFIFLIVQVHLRLHWSGRACRVLQRRGRSSGDPSTGRHEPCGQGVCGLPDQQPTWSADCVAVRWRGRNDARSSNLQSLRVG